MNAFIALENYIVKEEKDFGVGVPVTLNEQVAMYESQRKKNVQSYNNWLSINIPDSSLFLKPGEAIDRQSEDVQKILNSKDFIMALFIHEARIVFTQMDSLLSGNNNKEESDKIFEDFTNQKRKIIYSFDSGQSFFNFINSKCLTHDKAKSSALLYHFGIKGCRYLDKTGEKYLIFNAKKDIVPLEYRNERLLDSKLVV